MTAPKVVLVVSGDRLFGEAAAHRLGAAATWEASFVPDGLAAIGSISRRPPDAVLVLGDVPRLGAVPLTQQIRRRWPDVTVVVVGRDAGSGAVALDPAATTDEVLAALQSPAGAAAPAAGAPGPGRSVLAGLTQRQRVVLRLLAEGRDMRAIAGELGVSEHTVRTHMQNLYARLGCHSRLELVRFATEQGLITRAVEDASG